MDVLLTIDKNAHFSAHFIYNCLQIITVFQNIDKYVKYDLKLQVM